MTKFIRLLGNLPGVSLLNLIHIHGPCLSRSKNLVLDSCLRLIYEREIYSQSVKLTGPTSLYVINIHKQTLRRSRVVWSALFLQQQESVSGELDSAVVAEDGGVWTCSAAAAPHVSLPSYRAGS